VDSSSCDAPDSVEAAAAKGLVNLTVGSIDLDCSQGDVGLFVPDAGYPFGVIPDWLIRQRCGVPDWHEDSWPPTRAR
jgi:hypothetical protein